MKYQHAAAVSEIEFWLAKKKKNQQKHMTDYSTW